MEIERKYLVSEVPANLKDYHCRVIEQGYLSTPITAVVRRNIKLCAEITGMPMICAVGFPLAVNIGMIAG